MLADGPVLDTDLLSEFKIRGSVYLARVWSQTRAMFGVLGSSLAPLVAGTVMSWHAARLHLLASFEEPPVEFWSMEYGSDECWH